MLCCALAVGATSCRPNTEPKTQCPEQRPSSQTVHRIDQEGRVLIHRGINVSNASKWAPDFLPPVETADYQRMVDWGFTSIRFLVFWEAIEPMPGQYNQDYLDGVRAKVLLAADLGLDVLLDMHQDVYGRGFDHAGFPRWTCDEALYATYTAPSQWFLGYFEPEVITCFERFWQSHDLQRAYAQAAAQVAQAVADIPQVSAFEVINEPFWASMEHEIFESQYLQPFTETVATAIGDVAPHMVLVAEPSVANNIGVSPEFTSPFGCPTWQYAPHFYPPFTETGAGYSGDVTDLAQRFARLVYDAQQLGAPLAVTEYGMKVTDPGALLYYQDMADIIETAWASAWIWEYGPGGGFALVDANHQPTELAAAFLRPWAHRIGGLPTATTWDATSETYTLTWTSSSQSQGQSTIIVIPAQSYPQGYSVASSDPDGTWSVSSSGTRLIISPDPSNTTHGITITPM